jgi:hypothetical protein
MVVVPTATDVHLTYERSNLDYFAYLLTFLGIAMLIVMRIRGDVRHANAHPFGNESEPIPFPWEDWDSSSEELLVDPTPSEQWQPAADDPLDADLDAESLVWAPPAEDPHDSHPPSASL